MPQEHYIPFLTTLSGLALTVVASRWVVSHASRLAWGTSIPPFLVGITIVAIGTDGPEIANSIMASLAGHGDLAVGNSVGSVFVQASLILGLLPFFGGSFAVSRTRSTIIGASTAGALCVGAFVSMDDYFSRWDGLLLVATWLAATAWSWRATPDISESSMEAPTRSRSMHAVLLLLSLGLVVAGAAAAVDGLVSISGVWGVPEYLISFFGSSLGTSLPELVVGITALRQGQRDIAYGDILGACLLDATLSMGIGPALYPVAINGALAVRGAFLAIGAVVLGSALLRNRGRHDRTSGAVLVGIYGVAYVAMLQ